MSKDNLISCLLFAGLLALVLWLLATQTAILDPLK